MEAYKNFSDVKDSTSSEEHPRVVLPALCQKFYGLGWMYGTGGALSIKCGDKLFTTPSGVNKDLVKGEDLFVTTVDGVDIVGPSPEKRLSKSTCTPLINAIYTKQKGVGAVYHLHNTGAVMVSMLSPGVEFRITHQKLIQGIKKSNSEKHFDYYDTLIVPIVENKSTEDEIVDSLLNAMRDYPETSAVIIRRHGMYVWGPTWQRAKGMAECYEYLFNVAVKMKQLGLDPEAIPVPPEGAYT
ncbi:MTNB-like protein [Mya arenaria]|uniref:Probable methylthioribulose-1-phosphate dehydratase n=1 Tax=Mya arenaria TaxID=6604 RepID=A0ABY7DZW9_MYAAR|nr:methylthioribulose-1-phosphate dehydratase-like [Mya arenaria]WAR02153.1 MTNB-like protein [Mya arenaria]